MAEAKIAERIFDGIRARTEFEVALDDTGLKFDRTRYDDYDGSVEIYDVAPTDRLSVEVQRVIHAAGFSIAYVNHTDIWETHYRFDQKQPFRFPAGASATVTSGAMAGQSGWRIVCQAGQRSGSSPAMP